MVSSIKLYYSMKFSHEVQCMNCGGEERVKSAQNDGHEQDGMSEKDENCTLFLCSSIDLCYYIH